MKKDTIVYGTYYRKSSEADDRQAQSIPDQITETEATAKRDGLTIGMRFPGESQSAHSPGRQIFADLVKAIMMGKINAILVWHANRLARNPVDAGMIIHLMDIGQLKEIRMLGKVFRNTSSDKFVLQLEFGISKKDSDDKSEAIKRGLDGRARRGLPNGVAHIGYTNDQTKESGSRDWIEDPVRYPLVKKLLTMMLTGKYSVPKLQLYAKDEMRLTTPVRKTEGGKPIALSYMYDLLRDPIHAGFFFQECNGEKVRYEFKGVKPMITEDEYWKIQDMMGSNGKKRTTKRMSAYSPFTTCGTCNGPLSADFKFQIRCSGCRLKFSSLNKTHCPGCKLAIDKMVDPTYLSYVFYYCVNNKKHRTDCPASGIEEKSLQKQLVADIGNNLAISKELSAWCIENIGKLKDQALDDRVDVRRNLEQEKAGVEGKLERLTMLRISRDYGVEENAKFDRLQKTLEGELSLIDLRLADTNVDWFGEAKKDFDLLSEMLHIIQNGTVEQKKDLLHTFRSNLAVSAKKLTVYSKKSIEAFKSFLLLAKAENKAFEPENIVDVTEQNDDFTSIRPTVLRGPESNRRLEVMSLPRYLSSTPLCISYANFARSSAIAIPLRGATLLYPAIRILHLYE